MENIQTPLAEIYQTCYYHDAVIQLRNGEIPVHRCILHQHSPYLRRALVQQVTKFEFTQFPDKVVVYVFKEIYGIAEDLNQKELEFALSVVELKNLLEMTVVNDIIAICKPASFVQVVNFLATKDILSDHRVLAYLRSQMVGFSQRIFSRDYPGLSPDVITILTSPALLQHIISNSTIQFADSHSALQMVTFELGDKERIEKVEYHTNTAFVTIESSSKYAEDKLIIVNPYSGKTICSITTTAYDCRFNSDYVAIHPFSDDEKIEIYSIEIPESKREMKTGPSLQRFYKNNTKIAELDLKNLYKHLFQVSRYELDITEPIYRICISGKCYSWNFSTNAVTRDSDVLTIFCSPIQRITCHENQIEFITDGESTKCRKIGPDPRLEGIEDAIFIKNKRHSVVCATTNTSLVLVNYDAENPIYFYENILVDASRMYETKDDIRILNRSEDTVTIIAFDTFLLTKEERSWKNF